MEYALLGRSDLLVSRVALGTMNFGDATGEDTSLQIMDAAVEQGINGATGQRGKDHLRRLVPTREFENLGAGQACRWTPGFQQGPARSRGLTTKPAGRWCSLAATVGWPAEQGYLRI
jgi:hypothetical protein